MRGLVRRFLGWVVAAAVTLAVVGLSSVPYTADPSADGELRLAWRFRSDRVSRCRRLSAEEQARLPQHMRRVEDCERGLRPYRLRVTFDGGTATDDTVSARGAERDRPLVVLRRVPLQEGVHRVAVDFSPLGEGGPAPLRLDTAVAIRARQVVLVTYDDELRRLVVRTR